MTSNHKPLSCRVIADGNEPASVRVAKHTIEAALGDGGARTLAIGWIGGIDPRPYEARVRLSFSFAQDTVALLSEEVQALHALLFLARVVHERTLWRVNLRASDEGESQVPLPSKLVTMRKAHMHITDLEVWATAWVLRNRVGDLAAGARDLARTPRLLALFATAPGSLLDGVIEALAYTQGIMQSAVDGVRELLDEPLTRFQVRPDELERDVAAVLRRLEALRDALEEDGGA